MTDWNSLPWGLDASHHNGQIDWDRVAAQEPACVILKATERRWTSPAFERNRRACADRGLRWIPYVFLRPDDDGDTIQYFLNLLDGAEVPVALDWEEPQGPGTNPVPAEVVERWIDAMPRPPLVYYGIYPPAKPTAKIGQCPRWYAQYPGSATANPKLRMWDGSPHPDWRKVWLIWQWTDKGSVDGISGNVDMNRIACSVERFETWYRTGSFEIGPTPAPTPTAEIHPVLYRGAKGAVVGELQRRLKTLGFDPGPIDNDYGLRTEKAVSDFQKARQIMVPGVAGRSTWNEIAHAESERST